MLVEKCLNSAQECVLQFHIHW